MNILKNQERVNHLAQVITQNLTFYHTNTTICSSTFFYRD